MAHLRRKLSLIRSLTKKRGGGSQINDEDCSTYLAQNVMIANEEKMMRMTIALAMFASKSLAPKFNKISLFVCIPNERYPNDPQRVYAKVHIIIANTHTMKKRFKVLFFKSAYTATEETWH